MRSGGTEELVMEDTARISVDGKSMVCVDIIGQKKVIKNAMIAEIDLVGHRIILEEYGAKR
jgi:predicted RNA-binding protein